MQLSALLNGNLETLSMPNIKCLDHESAPSRYRNNNANVNEST